MKVHRGAAIVLVLLLAGACKWSSDDDAETSATEETDVTEETEESDTATDLDAGPQNGDGGAETEGSNLPRPSLPRPPTDGLPDELFPRARD